MTVDRNQNKILCPDMSLVACCVSEGFLFYPLSK